MSDDAAEAIRKHVTGEERAKAIRLLEAATEPHDRAGADGDHEWRECRRCLALEEAGREPGRALLLGLLAELRLGLGPALDASLGLQAHYAELLNAADGGKRLVFRTRAEWLARLAALAAKNGEGKR